MEGTATATAQKRPFVAVMSSVFKGPNQKLPEFAAELSALSYEDKMDYHRLLVAAGHAVIEPSK